MTPAASEIKELMQLYRISEEQAHEAVRKAAELDRLQAQRHLAAREQLRMQLARERCRADRLDAEVRQLRAKVEALEYVKAKAEGVAKLIDGLTASNAALRIEIERLGAPEHASNAEAAAWRWATGNDTQAVAVCELDGTEWIPVLSSRAGLAAVAAEIAKRNYGPQWTAGSVLARMASGAERGE
jgi:hypothetical protein